ncbi:hypothetical protein [Occallatibacter savannae]|uniref:hypothetical protein n=1 Tax=Occallatibacter savannae TaxID=1002691 RepID=UPI001EF62D81|nr:hypothetical protein [Occallatibacter savannae]
MSIVPGAAHLPNVLSFSFADIPNRLEQNGPGSINANCNVMVADAITDRIQARFALCLDNVSDPRRFTMHSDFRVAIGDL